jgi:hypothetical protein
MRRELCELLANLVERESYALRKYNECDSPQHFSGKVPLSRPFALRPDETTLLVEPKRRSRDSAPSSDLSDTE